MASLSVAATAAGAKRKSLKRAARDTPSANTSAPAVPSPGHVHRGFTRSPGEQRVHVVPGES